ncbi:MAG: tubulin-like doman-containing protein [Meiothermus sp.]|nr:tubulin-like doman-containing protein [Meiothermus sp.]
MSADIHAVSKTLVIGLGSTGARICDRVAERVAWDFGGLARAPWVRFACLETNANERNSLRFIESADFRNLTISTQQYAQILANPGAYDQKIGLTSWWDQVTLEKLPGMAVETGAGNIRMVGRLAFFFGDNFNRVHAMVKERLDDLRTLSEADAKQRRGVMPDGSNPDVTFGDGKVKVFVVGTLCGGTGSGLAADFGYFLNRLLDQEKTIAIFTLPLPELTPAVEPLSEKHKKNAYTALVELNHYYLNNRVMEAPIQFPDGTESDPRRHPYELPYLVCPPRVGKEGEDELNQAVADRVFLNIAAPQADPRGKTVDATIYGDRDHQAHVFSTFGLASVEYPVQRITEACRDRLVAHALTRWVGRTLPEDQARARAEGELGFNRASFLQELQGAAEGGELLRRLLRTADDIAGLAESSASEARGRLDALRQELKVGGPVHRRLIEARGGATQRIVERVKADISQRLLSYNEGPGVLQQTLDAAAANLAAMAKQGAGQAPQDQVDDMLASVEGYARSRLLGAMGVRQRTVAHWKYQASEEIKRYVRARLDYLSLLVLQGSTGESGQQEPGVLTAVGRQVAQFRQRLKSLADRANTEVARLNLNSRTLAANAPAVVGLVIFEPDTVNNEYRQRLGDWAQTQEFGAGWEQGQEMISRAVVEAWGGLREDSDHTLPGSVLATSRQSWLDNTGPVAATAQRLPRDVLSALWSQAVEPFRPLSQEDVLNRWGRMPDKEDQARHVARTTQPFLEVDKAHAEQGNRSPIAGRTVVILPRGATETHDRFFDLVSSVASGVSGGIMRGESPDKFRAAVLAEEYRFPLRGCPQVMGSGGLAHAQNAEIPTFHTRTDVFWTGLTEAFARRFRRAEELLVVSILLGHIVPRGGFLEMPWTVTRMGDDSRRLLPLDVFGAASYLAREELDRQNRPLSGAMQALENHALQARKSGEGPDRERAFLDRMRKALDEGGRAAGIEGWTEAYAGEVIERYCSQDPELSAAYQAMFPKAKADIDVLWREANAPRPGGGVYKEPGYYCRQCGGLIGRTVQDASYNNWKCYVNPAHKVYG